MLQHLSHRRLGLHDDCYKQDEISILWSGGIKAAHSKKRDDGDPISQCQARLFNNITREGSAFAVWNAWSMFEGNDIFVIEGLCSLSITGTKKDITPYENQSINQSINKIYSLLWYNSNNQKEMQSFPQSFYIHKPDAQSNVSRGNCVDTRSCVVSPW